MQLSIEVDHNPESPREWDNLGTMICWHRKYNLGDKQPSEGPLEFLRAKCEEHFDRDLEGYDISDLESLFDEFNIALPLYLYDHSGITMSTSPFSCPWDSGQVGFIYISHEKILKEFGTKPLDDDWEDRAINVLKSLRAEVAEYDAYLRGDVYGFTIYGDNKPDNPDFSCWGFYGTDFSKNGMTESIPEKYHHLIPLAIDNIQY